MTVRAGSYLRGQPHVQWCSRARIFGSDLECFKRENVTPDAGGIAVDLSESEDAIDAFEAIAPAECPNREGSLKSAGDLAWSEDDTPAFMYHEGRGYPLDTLLIMYRNSEAPPSPLGT